LVREIIRGPVASVLYVDLRKGMVILGEDGAQTIVDRNRTPATPSKPVEAQNPTGFVNEVRRPPGRQGRAWVTSTGA
jgi:hypothetical protein